MQQRTLTENQNQLMDKLFTVPQTNEPQQLNLSIEASSPIYEPHDLLPGRFIKSALYLCDLAI